MTTMIPGQECDPRPMAVRDLRCGDEIHVNGYFGTTHWVAEGAARESWPVPGKVHVPKLGCGTFAPFASFGEIVLVCSTGHCHSSLCGAAHR
jgi:hypothetical protein